uniref:PRP21_like_P domain-containing protein n=1 Tax=Macrostomum lignano TaxID=282301 RepID=A0A1I8FFR7_9PLAT
VPKLSSRQPQPVYYPVPPQLLGANAAMRPDPAADPAAEFPVALTDWQEKQTEALMRGASGGGKRHDGAGEDAVRISDLNCEQAIMMELVRMLFHRLSPCSSSGPPFLRAAAAPGRVASPAVLLATAQPRCQAVSRATSRTAAERVRPETDRERSERWLLEGREYHNLADNWDALVQAAAVAGRASQASSRPESPVADESADGQRPAERDGADAKDGGYGGGQAWGQRVGSRYRDYSRRRVESDSRRSPQPVAIADTDARVRHRLAAQEVRAAASASWSFSDGAGLMNTLGLPGPAVGYLPGRPRLYELHGASLAAAPAAQKQQPQQQAKSSKGVNFDTDVMVAYGYGSEPVYLDQEQLPRL